MVGHAIWGKYAFRRTTTQPGNKETGDAAKVTRPESGLCNCTTSSLREIVCVRQEKALSRVSQW
jgi:hypothetical protein